VRGDGIDGMGGRKRKNCPEENYSKEKTTRGSLKRGRRKIRGREKKKEIPIRGRITLCLKEI